MTSLLSFLKSHEKTCLAISLVTLSGYLFYRSKQSISKKEENKLEVSLKELISKKYPHFKKIVITVDPNCEGNFRRNLVNEVKARLIEANIKVFFNCSVKYDIHSAPEIDSSWK